MSRRDEALAYLEKSFAAEYVNAEKYAEIKASIMAAPEDQPFKVSDAFYQRLADSLIEQLWHVYWDQIMKDGVGKDFFPDEYASGRLKFALDTFPEWMRKRCGIEVSKWPAWSRSGR